MKFLIVGLGNIGSEYELTRHNAGFLVLDQLAEKLNTKFESDRLASYAEGKYKGRHLHLIKPSTYMNLSGRAVLYWMNTLKIPKERVLVVVDDIALPFGNLRLRAKGSSAGHNGLKNIEEQLGGNQYPRLRFGIGDDFSKGRQADYVLSNFSKKELEQIMDPILRSIDIIFAFTTIGINQTMTQFNQ
ncbi:MAG: aminoacyl-tRNA hydrolase [Cyclobacteriaceae bacterium]|nr:aminoacyl-tRNA hydrolase [Cyclobacteriaceae bacterium]